MNNKNKLFYGDNLEILRNREYFPDESVDLIYLAPPFNSKRAYNVIFKDDESIDNQPRKKSRIAQALHDIVIPPWRDDNAGTPADWTPAEWEVFATSDEPFFELGPLVEGNTYTFAEQETARVMEGIRRCGWWRWCKENLPMEIHQEILSES